MQQLQKLHRTTGFLSAGAHIVAVFGAPLRARRGGMTARDQFQSGSEEMKEYRIFVQSADGAFGNVRVLPFEGDDAAVRFARAEILGLHPGCDVWGEQGRVALLRARDGMPAAEQRRT